MPTLNQLQKEITALQKENDKLNAEQKDVMALEYANRRLQKKIDELIAKQKDIMAALEYGNRSLQIDNGKLTDQVATQQRLILRLEKSQKDQASKVTELITALENALKAIQENKRTIANMEKFLDEIIAPP